MVPGNNTSSDKMVLYRLFVRIPLTIQRNFHGATKACLTFDHG